MEVSSQRFPPSARIVVLCGGFNEERNLSLQGGGDVAEALQKRGYRNVTLVDWSSADKKQPSHLLSKLGDCEVCFNCLHGPLGEDGTVSGLLETLRIPYTFSGVFGSACGSDKVRSKELLVGKPDVSLVPGVQRRTAELLAEFRERGECPVQLPVMVKDPLQGSSKGVWLCKTEPEYEAALLQVTGPEVVVERFVTGVDVVVCLLEDGGSGEVCAWPVMEFETDLEWQDNASKNALWGWKDDDVGDGKGGAEEAAGGNQSDPKPLVVKNCPPKHLAKDVEVRCVDMAKAVFRHLRAKTALNVEFRVTSTGEVFFIEVSVVPGITSASVHAVCAHAAEVSYPEVVERMLQTARLELSAASTSPQRRGGEAEASAVSASSCSSTPAARAASRRSVCAHTHSSRM
jgi:D-alanine-D-alanine ligase